MSILSYGLMLESGCCQPLRLAAPPITGYTAFSSPFVPGNIHDRM